MDFRNCKPVDPRAAKNGWAPPPDGHGEYACRCRDCLCTFAGAKRSTRCADCAYGHPFIEGPYILGDIPEETRKMIRESGISRMELVSASSPSLGFRERYFIDTLSTTGEYYRIPASRRAEWDIFDTIAEETSEALPVPDWAEPVPVLSHLVFELPQDIFA